nr:reverse transcriptase domain-containing protein [Tanacetum cinerariifolium]
MSSLWFSELHQLDTFYNALNSNDQDALDSAAGGNFQNKIPRKCLSIIESKSKKEFDKTMSWINLFVPMDSEVVKDKEELTQESSSKRAGVELDQEISKKPKVKDDKEFEELERGKDYA